MTGTHGRGALLEGDSWLSDAVLKRIREGRWRARATVHVGVLAVSHEYLVEAPPHATIDARAFIVRVCRTAASNRDGTPVVTAFADPHAAVAAFQDRTPQVMPGHAEQVTLTVEWQ